MNNENVKQKSCSPCGASTYVTPELTQKIRNKFEPLYNRPLSDNEVFEIVDNLETFVEETLKCLWKERYEHAISRS